MENLPNRIALVYDRVNKWGGAERVLLALNEIFPNADLFTAVYDSKRAPWAKVFRKVVPTFLQYFPKATSQHELYPWLTPLAFETLNFNDYDLVISITSADAKGIITSPKTLHICYCLTPTRYLWSHEQTYKQQLDPATEWVSRPVFDYLKRWDKIAASRPDAYISISQTVRDRVFKYYSRDSHVIYPPVDVEYYSQPVTPPSIADYFLYVGRLVAYKRAEVVVRTFNELQLPLAIIGLGSQQKYLKQIAGKTIQFLGSVADQELSSWYHHAKGLIFFHEEDFGIVPVEAMASGTPVIGLNRGGLSETVIHGVTGHLVEDSPLQLKNAILDFSKGKYDAKILKSHAQQFSKDRFKKEFLNQVQQEWKKFNRSTS